MAAPDLYQRIVEGDEIALRDAFRAYGSTARALARRIVGPDQADEIVEEAFLLIWTEPEHWASVALDVHILRLVRDIALAVRRRGITAALAADEVQPFPIGPATGLPDVVEGLDHEELQRAVIRLPLDQGRHLEDAWFDAIRHDDESMNQAMDALVEQILSGRIVRTER